MGKGGTLLILLSEFGFLSNFVNFLMKSLLFWNICGVENSESFSHLRFLLKIFAGSILALVEPKIRGSSTDWVCKNLGFGGVF